MGGSPEGGPAGGTGSAVPLMPLPNSNGRRGASSACSTGLRRHEGTGQHGQRMSAAPSRLEREGVCRQRAAQAGGTGAACTCQWRAARGPARSCASRAVPGGTAAVRPGRQPGGPRAGRHSPGRPRLGKRGGAAGSGLLRCQRSGGRPAGVAGAVAKPGADSQRQVAPAPRRPPTLAVLLPVPVVAVLVEGLAPDGGLDLQPSNGQPHLLAAVGMAGGGWWFGKCQSGRTGCREGWLTCGLLLPLPQEALPPPLRAAAHRNLLGCSVPAPVPPAATPRPATLPPLAGSASGAPMAPPPPLPVLPSHCCSSRSCR